MCHQVILKSIYFINVYLNGLCKFYPIEVHLADSFLMMLRSFCQLPFKLPIYMVHAVDSKLIYIQFKGYLGSAVEFWVQDQALSDIVKMAKLQIQYIFEVVFVYIRQIKPYHFHLDYIPPRVIASRLQGLHPTYKDYIPPRVIASSLWGLHTTYKDYIPSIVIASHLQGLHPTQKDYIPPTGITSYLQGLHPTLSDCFLPIGINPTQKDYILPRVIASCIYGLHPTQSDCFLPIRITSYM